MTKLPTKTESKLPRKLGPKIKFNDPLKGQYLELLCKGIPRTTAAKACGISYMTVLRHQKTDEEFSLMVEQAAAVATVRRIEKIEDSSDWRAHAWLLKHDPESKKDWAESGSRQDGNIVNVQINVDRSFDSYPGGLDPMAPADLVSAIGLAAHRVASGGHATEGRVARRDPAHREGARGWCAVPL